ncbi:MAG: hypothetical protein KatS3mg057_0179 [Herpetosiphonaceae bacterium]|nr:MAG: hypothetical protein KatS3mg057_0179 [Herpetosiphonaceae bacterium]
MTTPAEEAQRALREAAERAARKVQSGAEDTKDDTTQDVPTDRDRARRAGDQPVVVRHRRRPSGGRDE